MFKEYRNLALIGFVIGLVDYVYKGAWDWFNLPPFLMGWSWHITIFLFYFILLGVYLLIRSYDAFILTKDLKFIGISGLLMFINEDFFFYLIKSIFSFHFYYNTWFFPNKFVYFISIIVLNLISLFLLSRLSIEKILWYKKD